jgi:hypothetical protein
MVAPNAFCSEINSVNAATSCSSFPAVLLMDGDVIVPAGCVLADGAKVFTGGTIPDGVDAPAGRVLADGAEVFTGCVLTDGVDMPAGRVVTDTGAFVAAGAVVLCVVSPFTVTLQVSFVPPVVACTFALPSFFPLIVTATLPFFRKVMFFFPDSTFQVTFFCVFFTLSVLLTPIVTVSFFALKLTFFAADTPLDGIIPSKREKESPTANTVLFVLFLMLKPPHVCNVL